MKHFFFLISLIISICSISFGQNWVGEKKEIYKPKPNSSAKAASCVRPTGKTTMEYNNVRSLIFTDGKHWQITGQNACSYEIPKNSGIQALFTSALWLGGTDINNQLKLAAMRYRDGQDYWTGPLTKITAETSPDNCVKYDKHFVSTADEIKLFNAWYETGLKDIEDGTSLQSELYPNYIIPNIVRDWPAHGDDANGQDYYLAPFFDRNENGNYDPTEGEYPWYDFRRQVNCKTDRRVTLFGDQNFWWVMNDKGDIHTESSADPIGMEIRSQAFCFTSNDEINNMSFFNYELINRGTQTLYNTYFGVFTDMALGNPNNDFVGCDVNRGLAYAYNGTAFDGDGPFGFKGYGSLIPAVGIDFFEGPFQDNDNLDNGFGIGPNEALNGIGYGDGIIDNERFGMRRFNYYNNTSSFNGDPTTAFEYYNFLKGFWKDNSRFVYGGSGHVSDPNANSNVPCDFIFPGETDSLGWGTGGLIQPNWTEITAGNTPFDRRVLQSAGPFLLNPGAVNNITLGICWARSGSPGNTASLEPLFVADDKAQALFENCFKIVEGPNAPDVIGQELDREVVLTISNPTNSNNVNEKYEELDPFIATAIANADKSYNFQGYQVYQVVGPDVSVSDVENTDLARVVDQCDVQDGVGSLVNFEFEQAINSSMATQKVIAQNKGIRHSFNFKEDAFAKGTNKRLVNFKTYHYLVISYAHNNYQTYVPSDPGALNGQKRPYLASRKSSFGEVRVLSLTPHNPIAEFQGTFSSFNYGDSPEITRLDGSGNGNKRLEITASSENEIVENGFANEITYKNGNSPIEIKVIDPLNIQAGYFECKFNKYSLVGLNSQNYTAIDTASYTIYRFDKKNGVLLDSVVSARNIELVNELIIPNWGVSATIYQDRYFDSQPNQVVQAKFRQYPSPIFSGISYSDSSKNWFQSITDQDVFFPTNWIRGGLFEPPAGSSTTDFLGEGCYPDHLKIDIQQKYSGLLSGGAAPYALVGHECAFAPIQFPTFFGAIVTAASRNTLARAKSIDIVFTNNKNLWTKCPVIELGVNSDFNFGGAEKGTLRKSQSKDKNGNSVSGTGESWFPGYAIDLESGFRLQMAFGENSSLAVDNGADMLWNPTSNLVSNLGSPILGGQHPIYVFGVNNAATVCPFYSESNPWLFNKYQTLTNASYLEIYTNLMWVVNGVAAQNRQALDSDARIKLRIQKEFVNQVFTNQNQGRPMYSWSIAPNTLIKNDQNSLVSVLDLIGVVPNPYYAYSEYERDRLDQVVKFINLPTKCKLSIYNVSGKLVKSFNKDSQITYQDWNLTNERGVPIASGTYLIHVVVPEAGERIVKLFVGQRKVDMQGL